MTPNKFGVKANLRLAGSGRYATRARRRGDIFFGYDCYGWRDITDLNRVLFFMSLRAVLREAVSPLAMSLSLPQTPWNATFDATSQSFQEILYQQNSS